MTSKRAPEASFAAPGKRLAGAVLYIKSAAKRFTASVVFDRLHILHDEQNIR